MVAEITDWLVLRYEPGAKIPEDIDTESQRVAFVTAVAQVLASKARLSIKTKHLYAADGRAVREMLKIAKLLNSAVRTCQEAAAAGEEAEGERDGPGLSSAVRPSDLAATRTVASEITERGAKLYELLRREHELREARAAALSFLDGVGGGEDGGGSGTGVTGGSLGEQQAKLERVVRDAIANMKVSRQHPHTHTAQATTAHCPALLPALHSSRRRTLWQRYRHSATSSERTRARWRIKSKRNKRSCCGTRSAWRACRPCAPRSWMNTSV